MEDRCESLMTARRVAEFVGFQRRIGPLKIHPQGEPCNFPGKAWPKSTLQALPFSLFALLPADPKGSSTLLTPVWVNNQSGVT